MTAPPCQAQSLQTGLNQYQQYLNMKNGGSMGNAYAMLWQSYQNLEQAARNVKAGTTEYDQLRTTLRDMRQHLEQGWVYNSQMRQRSNTTLFGQAYLDIEHMPIMVGVDMERTSNYASIAYNTSAATYNMAVNSKNTNDFQKAITYFKSYLSTGETTHRRNVLQFMFNACLKAGDNESARGIVDEMVTNDPRNLNLLRYAINVCMETKDYHAMKRYLDRAIALSPNDTSLKKLQGQALEETQQYEQAVEVFSKLRQQNPRSLELAKHIGLCNYNLGVAYYNAAQQGSNVKRNQKMAHDHFAAAATDFDMVLSQESNSLKYAQALATSYLYSDQNDKLTIANQRLVSLGGMAVSKDQQPIAMSSGSQTASGNTLASSSAINQSAAHSTTSSQEELPLYSEFAKQFVEERLRTWQKKDPYETADEFRNRVTEETRNAKAKELLDMAEQEYIKTYTQNIRFDREMKLRPYDSENRVFLIESKYGELIVPVPRENNEARAFENGWSGMQFSNPQFYISGDKLTLSSLTFRTPSGRTYQYTGDKALNYTETVVDVQFDKLDNSLFASNDKKQAENKRQKQTLTIGQSDVDMDIPQTSKTNDKTFAVIICNEHYSMVSEVPMAENDGTMFAQYCLKTLGLPKENVLLYKDASYGVMLRAMRNISSIASAFQGDLNIIFYYAGHGIPNESTKDAFLLPVDADGIQTEGCYPLSKLYAELEATKAHSVVVFLDACFSGAKRDGGMLASARGVALKAKKEGPRGNMVVFSAASDDETAMPYAEKNHGLFTYFLLKKLKESKGDVTLQELGNYISTNVMRQSSVVNHKPQTPSVIPSTSIVNAWSSMKLIR